jgi:hypothetical protein
VVLNSQPTQDVAINLRSSNTSEGTVSLSLLVFTPTNWMIPQTVIVTGVDDHVSDSSQLYTIILSQASSADPLYSGINPPDVSVLSVSVPDLLPTITLTGGDVTAQSLGTATLLDTQATIQDPDSPFQTLNGCKLVANVSRNGTSNDKLSILSEGTGKGQVGVTTGGGVTFGGVTIGSWSGGSGTTPLKITFNGRATLTMVQEVLRNLQFRTSIANRSSLDRAVSMQFVMSNGQAANAAVKTVHVLTGGTPPVINLGSGSLPYKNRSGAQLVSAAASLTDGDSTTFGGGTLTVSLATLFTGDAVRIRRQGTKSAQIDATSDGKVKFGTTIIGSWTGGTGGKPLVISLKSTASLAAVQALIRNITFETSTANASLSSRFVQFQLTDGSGGSSATVTKTIALS